MILKFGPFELDEDRAELRGPDGTVALEPKAFALLCLLAGNADRVIPKEEMIERLWGGRFVTDAAVATAIRQVRQALGDDAERQAYLRTLRGLGHRFVAPVTMVSAAVGAAVSAARAAEAAEPETTAARPPTIAVLPFEAAEAGPGSLAQSFPADILSALARFRWLRVIARESAFRLPPGTATPETVRQVLGADYLLSGRIEAAAGRIAVAVDLVETGGGTLLWSDRFEAGKDDIHLLRERITGTLLAALDLSIPLAEAARTRMRPVEKLDAWSAYHRGLSHMYRFNRADNAAAEALFSRALALDPGLSVVLAARSFTHFQTAVMGYADRDAAVHAARQDAEQAMALDPLDPHANYAHGRVHVLTGRAEDGLPWLDQALRLSPSYAKAHYARGAMRMMTGDFTASSEDLGAAFDLSPLDPLLPVMRCVRAITHALKGNADQAVEWALLAARTSHGHYINMMGAVAALGIAGRPDLADHWARAVRDLRPDVTIRTQQTAWFFTRGDHLETIRRHLRAAGFPDGD